MAREYGRFWLSIWSDIDFLGLDRDAQWMYMALCSQPGMSTCGVLPYTPKRWANFAPATAAKQIERWVGLLALSRFVVIDPDTDELLIRTHLRWDKPLRTANTAKAVARTWAQIVSPHLRKVVLIELGRLYDEGENPEWQGWQLVEIKELLRQVPGGVVRELPS